jgi:N-acyl-D-aspartate/D-glutamate deacylase
MTSIRRTPKGINLGGFLPLNSLMIYVMGLDGAKSRSATEEERAEMRRLLHEAMDHGAMGFGFSFLQMANSHKDSDGSPMPTDVMNIEEAYNLARVLGERGEGTIQALVEVPGVDHKAEVEQLARISGRPVLHTVIMAIDAMPSFHKDQLEWLDKTHAEGLDVYAQALALRGWTEAQLRHWDVWLFAEFQAAGDPAARAAKAQDPEYRARLRAGYSPEMMIPVGGPIENYILSNAAGYSRLAAHEGKTLGEIAAELREPVTDVLMDLMAATKLEAEVKMLGAMSQNLDYNEEIMRHPRVLPGTSDGGAHPKFWSGGQYGTDMICWLVRDSGRMSLEEMHHKLSAVPAAALSLRDRGVLTEGQAADLFVYDYAEIGYDQGRYEVAHDLPGGDWRRIARARGIRAILVNGTVTFRDNECTGATPGVVLESTERLVGA